MKTKWVYLFEELDEVEKHLAGNWQEVKALLGGKGLGLAEMLRIGAPIPPGFTVTTEACNAYLVKGGDFPAGMWEQELEAMKHIEKRAERKFGDSKAPLLVACRSGTQFSMPGMMDTVLNIGLTDKTAKGLIELTGEERFVYDSYRRLVQMFGNVVQGIPDEAFEEAFDDLRKNRAVQSDDELMARDWKALTDAFKHVTKNCTGCDFPQDPYEQLSLATAAVFQSWNGKRAVDYRSAAGISNQLGTAVNVVTMVFGNMSLDSATGVAFTRNPANGKKKLYGDYLLSAQGEDVVAGIRNTQKIHELEKDIPEKYIEFLTTCEKLEQHYREMQNVEFTIERGQLWILQTRRGKRTARAAVKIAVDMANEGLISRKEAIMRITPSTIDSLLHPNFDRKAKQAARKKGHLFGKWVNASPGAAVGIVAFDANTAETWNKNGKQVILVRPFTKPEDVHGMLASAGVLTSTGGATSHAAVVARQFGTPCIVGAIDVVIDIASGKMTNHGVDVKAGEWVSIDGTTGEVFVGQIPTNPASFDKQTDLITLLSWADEFRTLGVWANADYPEDAARSRFLGAEGIGLCRTEHMFFEGKRLPIVQRMILAQTAADREKALQALLPFQRTDFEGIFRAMDGLPVVIRLLDPPLHEFLPNKQEILERVIHKRVKGETEGLLQAEHLLNTIEEIHENNPMMGLRGVRLSIVVPGIVKMQIRAIFEAACNMASGGVSVRPKIMIPLVSHVNELRIIQPVLEEVAKKVMGEKMISVEYTFGTMIEVPRAAITADEIATVVDFFSFGTNDLTQMTFGYSRDDAEAHFLLEYVAKGILPNNPFQTIDQDGVGELIKIAVKKGRATRPKLEIGICGEHGGEPSSIEFAHTAHLNYISCPPFRIPVARLAAAQAAIHSSSGLLFTPAQRTNPGG